MVLINAFNKDSEHFLEAQEIIKRNKILLCLPQNIIEFANVSSKFMSKKEVYFIVLKLLTSFDFDFINLNDIMLSLKIFFEEKIKIFNALILSFAINRKLPFITFDKELKRIYEKYI